MAKGKGSRDDEQVRILREIWNEMKSLNGRVDKLRGDVHDLRGDVQELRGDVQRLDGRAERLDGRMENLLLGAHAQEHRDFRERIVRLEVTTGVGSRP